MKIAQSADTINLNGHWIAGMSPTLQRLAGSEEVELDGVNHRRSILTYQITSGPMWYEVMNDMHDDHHRLFKQNSLTPRHTIRPRARTEDDGR